MGRVGVETHFDAFCCLVAGGSSVRVKHGLVLQPTDQPDEALRLA